MTMRQTTEQTVTRRSFLRRAGLAVGAVAVTGTTVLGYRAYDQGVFQIGDGVAYEPWSSWDSGRGLLPLVGAATLAPSPHNSQAWLFGIHRHHVDLFADGTRDIGAIDPFRRELHVGLGAAIENLTLEAMRRGLATDIEMVPMGGRSPHAARIVVTPTAPRPSTLASSIPRRHTNRYPFVTGRDVPGAALERMRDLADPAAPEVALHWVDAPRSRSDLGRLLVDATEAIVSDEEQSESDFRWLRQSWDEIQRRRDGITIDAAGLPDLTGALAKLLPAQSKRAAGESWVQSTRDRHTATAAAYGIVVVRDVDDVRQRLQGGRFLERIHLWFTANGLALHHMNQVTERADRERQLGLRPQFGDAMATFLPDGWQALTTFRVGHPTRAARRSPRRSVQEVLVS